MNDGMHRYEKHSAAERAESERQRQCEQQADPAANTWNDAGSEADADAKQQWPEKRWL